MCPYVVIVKKWLHKNQRTFIKKNYNISQLEKKYQLLLKKKKKKKKGPKGGSRSYERNERIVCTDKLKRIILFCLGVNIEKVVYSVVIVDLVITTS